jgi:RNA polymerase sigma-70 factor (ECF subfamily)
MDTLVAGREKFLAFLRRQLGDDDISEDILQEAFIKAIRDAPELRDKDQLVPWFYRVLRNAVIDSHRRKAASPQLGDLELLETVPAPDDEAAAELCECFRGLLPSLKPEYAELIESLELKQGSTAAEAARLHVTPTNLKVRRHRARQALRQALEATCRVCAEHHCLDCTCGGDSKSEL